MVRPNGSVSDVCRCSATVLNYAATHGGILVEVVGNPFDAPSDDLEHAITGAMRGSHFGQSVAFVTEAPEDFVSPYRVVLLFDAGAGPGDIRLCRSDPDSFETRPGEVVQVHAALCAKQKPLTSLSGRVSAPDGPEDPRFVRLMRQLTLNLFPPANPDRRSSDHEFFVP